MLVGLNNQLDFLINQLLFLVKSSVRIHFATGDNCRRLLPKIFSVDYYRRFLYIDKAL